MAAIFKATAREQRLIELLRRFRGTVEINSPGDGKYGNVKVTQLVSLDGEVVT